jgi:ornithine decarboxylase
MVQEQSEQFGLAPARLDRFLAEDHPPTPFVVLDLDVVRARYEALRRALPSAAIYYAVKANPAPEVVDTLAALGANFDLASPGELDICLGQKIPPQRLSFGNTIKRESTIAEASAAGVGLTPSTARQSSKSWPVPRPVRMSSAAR